MARSFDRIRSIVRKKRNKEKNENETNSKLEKLVNEVIIRRRIEKKEYTVGEKPQECMALSVEEHQTALYRRSYQVLFGVTARLELTRLD